MFVNRIPTAILGRLYRDFIPVPVVGTDPEQMEDWLIRIAPAMASVIAEVIATETIPPKTDPDNDDPGPGPWDADTEEEVWANACFEAGGGSVVGLDTGDIPVFVEIACMIATAIWKRKRRG